MKTKAKTSVSLCLLERLHELGLRHIFGVPGDYVLDFMDKIVESPIKYVGTCNELNAGYAADAYARLNGIGAAVVTYGVGAYSIMNAVAGAYAEQVPLILISGAPGNAQRKKHSLVHHLTKDYALQFEIFKKITADAVILSNPASAPILIDRALRTCLSLKRPVYIEIPMDVVNSECEKQAIFEVTESRVSDPESLEEAAEEAAQILGSAKNPVILAGVEIDRFRLASNALSLIEKAEIPFATTISSKSALPELHPQFIGVYQGLFSKDSVRRQIEESDAVLALGVWMTDFNTGIFTAKLDDSKMLCANSESLRIRRHFYQNVWLGDFIKALKSKLTARDYLASHPSAPARPANDYVPKRDEPITAKRFYKRISEYLDDKTIVIPETGDSVCAAPDFYVEEAENMLCQAYYLSIGYALPATMGASMAKPQKRVLALIGDGAFQMTAQELSTIVREKLSPIIFLINNRGYTIERLIHEGPYNDINNWDYASLPKIFGHESPPLLVETEGDLEDVLDNATKNPDKLIFAELRLDSLDSSPMLAKIAEGVRRMSGKKD